jgi:hypothetical protein
MGATVAVKEANGAGPTLTTVTSVRFCNADNNNPGLDTPCVINPAGEGNLSYSFWKSLFLDLSGTYTRISDVRFYPSGSIDWTLGTSGQLIVGVRDSGDAGLPVASYAQAAGSAASGYVLDDETNGHPYYKEQTTPYADVEDYSDSSPLSVDGDNHDDVEEQTKGVLLQLIIDGDATHGEMEDEQFNWLWDEI